RPAWNTFGADPQPSDITGGDKQTLIVPPTAIKSRYFNNEIIRRQWQVARAILANADAVVVMGYSLPESDLLMRYFLASYPSKIVVVDRSTAVVDRFR